jgi:SAM-dependent methyltransferase
MTDANVTCRSCGAGGLKHVLSLGESPLADRLLTRDDLGKPEIQAPLDVVFCPACALVQLTVSVSPEELFCNDYPYFSSVSPSLMAHFAGSAERIVETRRLGPDSLVVEAASNDGYMLRNFTERGIPVLGIDPADGPAKKAQEAGIRTLNTFFTQELAQELRDRDGMRADVFLANNVLAHVPDLNGFVAGMATLLKDSGVAVIEAPYLVDLVDKLEFDTIYHQHLCYFSVTALDHLFRRHGLFLNEVERTSIHGGSLRLFVEPRERVGASVRGLLEDEKRRGVDSAAYYADFAERVAQLGQDAPDDGGSGTRRLARRSGRRAQQLRGQRAQQTIRFATGGVRTRVEHDHAVRLGLEGGFLEQPRLSGARGRFDDDGSTPTNVA